MGRTNKTGIKWKGNSDEEKFLIRQYSKKYRDNNKEERSKSIKKYELKSKYNLSLDDYETLLKKQNEVCAICKESFVLHVDHCHETGLVRGLLCRSCNLGLGFFKDKPELFDAAKEYIQCNIQSCS